MILLLLGLSVWEAAPVRGWVPAAAGARLAGGFGVGGVLCFRGVPVEETIRNEEGFVEDEVLRLRLKSLVVGK